MIYGWTLEAIWAAELPRETYFTFYSRSKGSRTILQILQVKKLLKNLETIVQYEIFLLFILHSGKTNTKWHTISTFSIFR